MSSSSTQGPSGRGDGHQPLAAFDRPVPENVVGFPGDHFAVERALQHERSRCFSDSLLSFQVRESLLSSSTCATTMPGARSLASPVCVPRVASSAESRSRTVCSSPRLVRIPVRASDSRERRACRWPRPSANGRREFPARCRDWEQRSPVVRAAAVFPSPRWRNRPAPKRVPRQSGRGCKNGRDSSRFA